MCIRDRGGTPSSRQTALVQATLAKLPAGAEIVAAFDADAGRKLVEVIREAVSSVANRSGRSDLIFRAQIPDKEGEDWNQVLQNAVLILHPAPDDNHRTGSNWTCQRASR